ncbi:MAG: hypothetical protein IPH09_12995 [bacterium]|nr:hypothetical protein [bacterium]
MGITILTDQQSTGSMEPFQIVANLRCAGTCTRGYGVSLDSSGYITNSATATLWAVVGIAMKAGVAGDTIPVLVKGWCDFGISDGNIAATDYYVYVVDGGTLNGATLAEAAGTNNTLLAQAVGKCPVAADSGTTISFWVSP